MTVSSNSMSDSGPKHIALVTDAWLPQVNGVVRTLQTVVRQLESFGHTVTIYSPDMYKSIACPTYPEIRLAYGGIFKLGEQLEALEPDIIHIATEGPLGFAARALCTHKGWRFTTSFHTKFPEYVSARFKIPKSWCYKYLKWFHNHAHKMMVATPTLHAELEGRGFTRCTPWSRGVDTTLFHPEQRIELDLPRPLYLYVGRVAVEKNLEEFLELELEGTKVVVGDGPQREELEEEYEDVVFLGQKHGHHLAEIYASADCFVFPSLTDTFGLVMLEALACGTPVAAYPVTGPIDVIKNPAVGCLHDDLETAIETALTLDRNACVAYAQNYSWEACARMLEEAFVLTHK
ncbi:MAG: glycosyltransferase family 1 protein [Rickettsiales bacterium]|nr:glycosyltransferase family 1 protein [Rickettsiales bacterium]